MTSAVENEIKNREREPIGHGPYVDWYGTRGRPPATWLF